MNIIYICPKKSHCDLRSKIDPSLTIDSEIEHMFHIAL